MGELIPLADEEAVAIKNKIFNARKQRATQSDLIKRSAAAYFREPLGTEIEGRSDYVSSAVHNHVEGALPALMKRNLSSDHKIKIKGKDPIAAKGLKQWARERINDQGGFRLFNDVLKDGLIYSNGTAKVWWQRIWGKPITGEKILDEKELKKLEANVEWTIESKEELPRKSMMQVDPEDPEMLIAVESAQLYRVVCTYRELVESGPIVVPMPTEEWLVEKGKIRMNDRKGAGHIRTMLGGELIRENERLSSVDGAPYYRNLKKAIAAPADITLSDEKIEREAREAPYWELDTPTQDESYSSDDLRKTCLVVEWSDQIISGGKLVPAIITFVNGEVVRCEKNDDGIVPFITWSPMVDPHSIYGHGIGWLHADDQNVQTVLTRAVLDSVAFSIDKPRMIASRSADLLGLQELTPGKLVVGREGDYKDIDVGELDYRIFQAIEFLKGEGEERGPGTRYNMGTDADTLNGTATGVSLIQRASLNKMDMISLAFSELFLVDLYNKLIFLAQNNLDKPIEMLVDGRPWTMTRENIQGDYRAEGDLGLEVDFDDRAFQKAQGQLGSLMEVSKTYPMLAPLEVVQEHLKNVYVAAGEKDLGRLLPPIPPEFVGWFPGREEVIMKMAQFIAMQQQGGAPAPGGPPMPGGGGPPMPGGGPTPMMGAPPMMPQDMGTGIMVAEPQGRDFVAGQSTAQPDESLLGM